MAENLRSGQDLVRNCSVTGYYYYYYYYCCAHFLCRYSLLALFPHGNKVGSK
jgi:hypothetical protein